MLAVLCVPDAGCSGSHALVDVNGFVVGCLVGAAGDPAVWHSEVTLAGTSALQAAGEIVGKTKKTWNPTVRGDFTFLNVGYSFGTGSVVSPS